MSIVCCSMWYADAGKHLADRAMHLLSKHGVTRWLWTVRPAADPTLQMLDGVRLKLDKNVEFVVEDWEQVPERLPRLSKAGDNLLDYVGDEEWVLWHESDLLTPPNIAHLLAETPGAAVGGWPVLSHSEDHPELRLVAPLHMTGESFFYDTWGYRKDGVRFTNRTPCHPCVQPTPFMLDSVGSVVLIKAEYIRAGARMNGNGLVGLCESIRSMGGEVLCDPRVPVVQPLPLWTLRDD